MITRDWFPPAYGAGTPRRTDIPGYIAKKQTVKGVEYSVAISRPVRSWASAMTGGLVRTGARLVVALSQPRVEMDPTDTTTWQREYRFTN